MSYNNSPLNTKNRINFVTNEKPVLEFIKNYPVVELTMSEFVGTKRQTIDAYINWLTTYGSNHSNLGGRPKTVNSPSFGSKTFYKFDWNGVKGWPEVFQYLTDREGN
mgnify:FL=1|jgi:hypothetical protein